MLILRFPTFLCLVMDRRVHYSVQECKFYTRSHNIDPSFDHMLSTEYDGI